MKKILFYTQTEWAFGIVHNGLSRELYKHEFLAEILNWSVGRSIEEMKLIEKSVDFIVTSPCGAVCLKKFYSYSLDKVKIVSHGAIELYKNFIEMKEIFDECQSYAVINSNLYDVSKTLGIKRIPSILTYGCDIDRFLKPFSKSLKKVGYAGAKKSDNFFNNDLKRFYLIEQCCKNADLPLICNGLYHYAAMPAFYENVDCVVISSNEESFGLPFAEGAIAGRLIVGTEVGCNKIHKNSIVVPIEEKAFIEKTTEALLEYKKDDKKFQEKCKEIQDYAIKNYSWESNVEPWINFLNS